MPRRIRIRELTDEEIDELDKLKGFEKIRPVECEKCGFRGRFPRRLFHITGLRDDDRDILGLHMERTYGIEGYIFRTDGSRKFLETASCPKCTSTQVVFDLVM